MRDQKLKDASYEKLIDAVIHLYRGEIQRVNTWRTRLDNTPHWAIVMSAGFITWTFSGPERNPALILIAIPLVGALLALEAHRFQLHEVWRSRLRFLEENFMAQLLDPKAPMPRKEWMEVLAEDLRVPEHKGTWLHAVSVRLRRIYLWLILTLSLSWILKLNIHPAPADSVRFLLARARVGVIPGLAIFALMGFLLLILSAVAFWGRWQEIERREGEILDEEPGYEWRREDSGCEGN
ncbi:MAG: DUF2270 domain-containing protein [Candidatus Acetothermia bacterium]